MTQHRRQALLKLEDSEVASNFLMDEPVGAVKVIGNLALGANALGNSGTAITVDFLKGTVVTMTLTGNVTLTFKNVNALKGAGNVTGLTPVTFIFTQDATGGRTVTWPSTAKFPAGAPNINSAASAIDVWHFLSDGTNLYFQSGKFDGTPLVSTLTEGINNIGTVTANSNINFPATCNTTEISTATTGLAYTFVITGAVAGAKYTLISKITTTVAAGPTWAGAVKWTGGAAPTSSVTGGDSDLFQFYFDGTDFWELSRSLGNH